MRIGIIDADLIGRDKHRFPNLACEKISGYWKEQGAEVILLLDFNWPDGFDHVYISKVFTDTEVPDWLEETETLHLGGTGFYFDKAPELPYEIEHHMPDYHLYDEWIEKEVWKARRTAEREGKNFDEKRYMVQFKEYTEYSIGFLTRGCFRHCGFCVNQKYSHVFNHSPLSEFYDPSRRKICLLDDNFFGFPHWEGLFEELIQTGKPFKFKQGLDERILDDRKCELLFSASYDGDITFAFDNLSDYDLIKSKLEIIRKHLTKKKSIKFYVLVGYESVDEHDIESAFIRIKLLMQYGCLPYIMRYQDKNRMPWKNSSYRGMYVQIARWANQPSIFKKKSFRQFCEMNQSSVKTNTLCVPMKVMREFESHHKDIAEKYFDLKYSDYQEEDIYHG